MFPSNVDKKSEEGEIPVKLCNYTDVYYHDRIDASFEFMSATASPAEISRFQLQQGDVLLTKDSEEWDDIGVPALVTAPLAGVLCGYHLYVARPESVYAPFLFWAMKSRAVAHQLEGSAQGITRFGLDTDSLAVAKIPYPPLEEQRRIAAFLDHHTARIDALIAKKRRLLELLEEKRQAAVDWSVTKGLSPATLLKDSGFPWIGEVPAHWKVAPFKFVARMESGHTPDKQVPEYWENCTIPWVSLKDSGYLREHDRIRETSSYINDAGIANSSARILPTGTVIFSRDATVGLCAITEVPMAVSQHFVGWVCGSEMLPEFLLYVVKAMNQELERLTMGSTIQTIGMPDLNELAAPVPPLREQQAIVASIAKRLAALESLSEKTQQSIDLLQEKRSALITAAVSGQLDVSTWVPPAEKIPA